MSIPPKLDPAVPAYNFRGGTKIYHLPPQARSLGLKETRHLAKSAERGELPAPE